MHTGTHTNTIRRMNQRIMVWVGLVARIVLIEIRTKLWLKKCEGKKDNIQNSFNKKGAGIYRIQLLKVRVEGFCKHDVHSSDSIKTVKCIQQPQQLPSSQNYSTSQSHFNTYTDCPPTCIMSLFIHYAFRCNLHL